MTPFGGVEHAFPAGEEGVVRAAQDARLLVVGLFIRGNGPTASYVMNADGTGATRLTRGLLVRGGNWGTHR